MADELLSYAFDADPLVGLLALLLLANFSAVSYVWWYQREQIQALQETINKLRDEKDAMKKQRFDEQVGQIQMLQSILNKQQHQDDE